MAGTTDVSPQVEFLLVEGLFGESLNYGSSTTSTLTLTLDGMKQPDFHANFTVVMEF